MDINVPYHKNLTTAFATQAVLKWAAANGLTVTLSGKLAKYPGSLHWHFKRGAEPGTLELTIAAQDQRTWFSIKRGRAAAWTTDAVKRLVPSLSQALNS